MIFTPPPQYIEVPVMANSQMHYEYALRHPNEDFEVRYSINPLDSVFIQFNAMKNSTTSFVTPNKLFYGAFLTTMANIGNGKRTNIGTFYPNEVKMTYNADWAAFCYCKPTGDFGKGYKFCLGVAIHKDSLADAYYFYLCNDTTKFQTLAVPIFSAMKFK
jgi:hypothetical protein